MVKLFHSEYNFQDTAAKFGSPQHSPLYTPPSGKFYILHSTQEMLLKSNSKDIMYNVGYTIHVKLKKKLCKRCQQDRFMKGPLILDEFRLLGTEIGLIELNSFFSFYIFVKMKTN